MSVVPNVVKKQRKSESKPQSQLNKCLNEKRRREQENIYIEELAELISASTSDMNSLSIKPDKCAILQETVNQIRRIKQESGESDELQQSEVSSSKPTILANDVLGPLLLEALDGFSLTVNTDGKIEFVSDNISSFLKYRQDDLVDKSIYNIIHIGDHARFSSNLLPMSIGNGFGWPSEPNTSKSRSFNCRFLIKPPDDQDETMEEKQAHVSQYENMQVSALLLPFTGEKSEGIEGDAEVQNRLLCVARRIPHNEKSPSSVGVEQFTTRLDLTGKILAIDTSGVSSTYSQYLNKELVGRIVQELCHPSDLQKIDQHLKETLHTGNNTSGVYRLQVSQDRYVHVQTKSKRFTYSRSVSDQEFIMATHSIIRDVDSTLSVEGNSGDLPKCGSPSPTTSSASTVGTSHGISGNINGSMGGPMTTVSTISSSNSTITFPSLSPTHQDLLNDLGIDIFPSSSWDLSGSDSGLNTTLPTTSLGGSNYLVSSSPPIHTTTSISNTNSTPRALRISQTSLPSSSAFSSDLISTKESSVSQLSSTSSPISGHVAPFTNTFAFNSGQTQPSSEKISPNIISALKREDTSTATTEVPISSPATSVSGMISDVQVGSSTTQKLRNLLTQGTEEADSSASKGISNERNGTPTHSLLEHETNSATKSISENVNTAISTSRNENIILKGLLNQDDEDIVEISGRSQRLENDNIATTASESNSENHMRNINNNNNNNDMLRKLLNSDDDNKSYCTSQDSLIRKILKPESPEKNETENSMEANIGNGRQSNDAFLSQLGMEHGQHPSTSGLNSALADIMTTVTKRKSTEDGLDSNVDSIPKRANVVGHHGNMAARNPMLLSMLSQTPHTAPSVPTSIANSIVSQLPQDRLPKNLEKKLIHTPYTNAGPNPANSTSPNTTGAQFCYTQTPNTNRSLVATTLQQEVVTADSRAHITLAQPTSVSPITMTSGPVSFPSSQQPGFLNKILANADGNQLRSVVPSSTTSTVSINLPQQSAGNYQFSQTVPNLRLSEVSEGTNIGTTMSNHSDPLLSEILDQVWSLEEEMNLPPTADDSTLVKLLEVLGPSTPTTTVATTPDLINEKMAISVIQQQLMSCENNAASQSAIPVSVSAGQSLPLLSSSGSTPSGPVPPMAMSPSPLSPNTFSATGHYKSATQPPAYGSPAVPNQRHRMLAPVVPNSQQVTVNVPVQRAQFSTGISNVPVPPQMRRTLLERRQKLFLHQQQKRLQVQQQQQQLIMQTQQPLSEALSTTGPPTFTENMNELLNNTVAPNVALQRSSVPEQQLSPRFNSNIMGQLPSPIQQSPTPSQLSPGQRVGQHPPYSPLSQQSFPSPTPPVSSYQQPQPQPQHRLSPHPIPSYNQGHSPSPTHSPHLQLSPQPGTGPPQWTPRPTQNQASNNLQQQNPMLNAQLSQQAAFAGQVRFPAQQRQMAMRSMPSPSSLNSSRNSPYTNQPDSPYPPQSPGSNMNVFQQQPLQQRLQRVVSVPGRVNSPRSLQGSFVSGDPLLSPQSQPSPGGYTQSLSATPTPNYSSSSGMPTVSTISYSLPSDNIPFNFDQQIFTTNAMERNRGGNGGMTSEYVRQELRAMVGARTQQQQQQQQQQQGQQQQGHHQLHLGAPTPPNSQSLSAELETLGLSLELGPNEGQPSSPALYSQPLLSIAGGSDVQNNSPRVEDSKPNDQKKSLLQQLLSEPP